MNPDPPVPVGKRAIRARNRYRLKKGIPLDAPLHPRLHQLGRPKTVTVGKEVYMHPDTWAVVDRLRGRKPRGRWLAGVIETLPPS